MFDRKIGDGIPGKVVRIGKAWHGLVKSSESGLLADYVIETKGGKTIPFPRAKGVDEYSRPHPGFRAVGHVSVYMHPMASHEQELDNGMDWSQYVIMQLYRLNGFSIAGLSSRRITFFFTPDYDQSAATYQEMQAIPIEMTTDSLGKVALNVFETLKYDSPLEHIGRKSFELDPNGEYFHASTDGRKHYRRSFPAFQFGFDLKHTSFGLKPTVTVFELSGYLSDVDDPLATINMTSTTDNSAPNDYHEEEFYDDVIYRALASSNPIEYEDVDYLPTGTGRRWFLISRDYRNHEKTKGAVMPCVNDNEEIVYLIGERSDTETISSSGSVTYTETGHTSDRTDNITNRRYFEVSLGADLSSVEVITHTTNNNWTNYVNGDNWFDPPKVDETDGETTSVTSIKIDGDEFLSIATGRFLEMGIYYRSPFVGVDSVLVSGKGVYGIHSEKRVSDSDYQISEISLSLANFYSADLSALMVQVRTGILRQGESNIDISTVQQKVFIGKVFSKGATVLDDPIILDSEDIDPPTGLPIDFDVSLHRAYNPLTREISAVHRYPLIYQ